MLSAEELQMGSIEPLYSGFVNTLSEVEPLCTYASRVYCDTSEHALYDLFDCEGNTVLIARREIVEELCNLLNDESNPWTIHHIWGGDPPK